MAPAPSLPPPPSLLADDKERMRNCAWLCILEHMSEFMGWVMTLGASVSQSVAYRVCGVLVFPDAQRSDLTPRPG